MKHLELDRVATSEEFLKIWWLKLDWADSELKTAESAFGLDNEY
jgi:hypothetical protein